MSIIERAFSIHDDALQIRSRRTSILAANIANADTPNYKARDLDFAAIMGKLQNAETSFRMTTTSERHMQPGSTLASGDIRYRNPLNPSLDGNTVDMSGEQARFAENAAQYQASLTMVNSKIRGMLLAIKGQ